MWRVRRCNEESVAPGLRALPHASAWGDVQE